MRRPARAAALVSTTAVALPLLAAAPALAAGRPQVVHVDRTFVSPLLTEVCGVEVTQHLVGSFSSITNGDRTITNFRFRSTLTAGDNVVDSRAFGPTMEIRNADGTITSVQLGVTMRNLPGSGTAGPFAGRSVVTLVLDEAGEVVEEIPVSDSGLRQDLTELCAALTA